MNVICCISHLYTPTAITLVKKYGVENTLIFTDQESIAECLHLLFPKIRIHTEYPIKKFWPIDIIKGKKSVDKFVSDNEFGDVVFFHEGFGGITNYFLLQVSKNANIIYIPLYKSLDYNKLDKIYSPKLYIKGLYQKYIWGYRFGYCRMYSSLYPVLKRSFFDKIKPTESNVNIDDEYIRQVVSEKILTDIDYPSNSCVLLAPNGLDGGSMTKNKKELLDIERVIVDNSHNVLLKKHPRLGLEKNEIEKDLKEIPSFITGTLIIPRFKCFVGISSTILSDAAKIGIPGISIIDLLKDNISEDVRVGAKQMYKDLGYNVMFPQTLDELKEMLINIYHE